MLTHIKIITIVVLPVVVAGLLLAFFAQPKEARTVEVAFEPQPGINILYTTGLSCANELSLEEFKETYSAEILLVDSDVTSNFKLFLVANDSTNTCVKAKLVSTDPTVYEQVLEDYEIDLDEGLLMINVGSRWNNSNGVDSAGIFNPYSIFVFSGILSVLWVITLPFAWYTNTWKSSH